MFIRTTLAATVAAVALLTTAGCAVTRGQETVGAYVDDTAITTAVKARFIDNKDVDAASIKVETLNGTVMLSGFAKNATEKTTAESIAMRVNGNHFFVPLQPPPFSLLILMLVSFKAFYGNIKFTLFNGFLSEESVTSLMKIKRYAKS